MKTDMAILTEAMRIAVDSGMLPKVVLDDDYTRNWETMDRIIAMATTATTERAGRLEALGKEAVREIERLFPATNISGALPALAALRAALGGDE